MKKLLMLSAAAIGFVAAPSIANAQIDITVGGHSKNYLGWHNQDGDGTRNFDILRESELHVNAEGTADNGLIYGFHAEMEIDAQDGENDIEESYVYLASNLGRVNLGSEDGANYLLQVAAPSADSNIDGIRAYINPVNYGTDFADLEDGLVNLGVDAALAAAMSAGAANTLTSLDYANDATGYSQKITYLSPVWNGFQLGASYTPRVDDAEMTGLSGFNFNGEGLDDAYEAAARYEGIFNNVGFALGGGYTHVENETDGDHYDDVQQWNVGADFDIGAFGIGAAYTETNSVNGVEDFDVDTVVVGADYTTGPFQFGASYLNADVDSIDLEGDRYTGGVIYTAAPGLTFRGSVSHAELDIDGEDADATSVLGGIQINF